MANFIINGGKELHGEIIVNSSKNAAVAILMASLINRGTSVLKNVPRIEEVFRLIEVLGSLNVKVEWSDDERDLKISPPKELNWRDIDVEAARKTRSAIMLMGSFLHFFPEFSIPFTGGCTIGERTIEPHLQVLSNFGLTVDTKCDNDFYNCKVTPTGVADKSFVLIERGDTVTEQALIAAALNEGTTVIKNASANYMVRDVCYFLEALGVSIDGVGTTTLTVHGLSEIRRDVEFVLSEDPIEAMTWLTVGITTGSEIVVKRTPIEFLEIELAVLREMGLNFTVGEEYLSLNGRTRLADIAIKKSNLVAPIDKIHPMPFPGLNIDNLNFFAPIAAVASGRTLIHDWVFENRVIYLSELQKLGVRATIIDAHRMYIDGPTNWQPAELVAPSALRPAVVLTIGMLAAKGESVLRNTYSIERGYQDFATRLRELGADIRTE